MGDRAMAEIKVQNGSLYFYTHWTGERLPEDAETALAEAKPRLGDDSYALKIVVDNLIFLAGARNSETGAGLLLRPNAEDEYNGDEPSVIIDLVEGTVCTRGRLADG